MRTFFSVLGLGLLWLFLASLAVVAVMFVYYLVTAML